MASCMTTRERFHAVMNFQPFDRLPMIEWAMWWNKTLEAWHTQGLPAQMNDRYELYDYFGLEQYWQTWYRPRKNTCPRAPYHGGPIIEPTLEAYEILKPHLFPDPAQVVKEENWRPWIERQQRGDAVLWFTIDGYFWFPRTLLGVENHFYTFADCPELLHRMNRDLCDWTLAMLQRIRGFARPDFITFAEDMSYNHGPMLGPDAFEEFIAPYYRKLVPVLHDMGTKVVIDTDGDVTDLSKWFRKLGVDGMLPLERQAGCDAMEIRKAVPGMGFIGHFDKMTMTRGESAMRAEFERLLPLAASGGYLISVDHQTPPAVTLEDYRIFLRLFDEYARRAGEMSAKVLGKHSACHEGERRA